MTSFSAQRLDAGENFTFEAVVVHVVSHCERLNLGPNNGGALRLTEAQAKAADTQTVSTMFRCSRLGRLTSEQCRAVP